MIQKYGENLLSFPEGFSYTVFQLVHDSFYQQYHQDPWEWNKKRIEYLSEVLNSLAGTLEKKQQWTASHKKKHKLVSAPSSQGAN